MQNPLIARPRNQRLLQVRRGAKARESGEVALTRQAATLTRHLRIEAEAGAIVLSGQAAGLAGHLLIGADAGAVALTGHEAVLVRAPPSLRRSAWRPARRPRRGSRWLSPALASPRRRRPPPRPLQQAANGGAIIL